jgi:hypothetical protein
MSPEEALQRAIAGEKFNVAVLTWYNQHHTGVKGDEKFLYVFNGPVAIRALGHPVPYYRVTVDSGEKLITTFHVNQEKPAEWRSTKFHGFVSDVSPEARSLVRELAKKKLSELSEGRGVAFIRMADVLSSFPIHDRPSDEVLAGTKTSDDQNIFIFRKDRPRRWVANTEVPQVKQAYRIARAISGDAGLTITYRMVAALSLACDYDGLPAKQRLTVRELEDLFGDEDQAARVEKKFPTIALVLHDLCS